MQYEHTHIRTHTHLHTPAHTHTHEAQPGEIFAEMPKKSSESEVKLKAAEQNEN